MTCHFWFFCLLKWKYILAIHAKNFMIWKWSKNGLKSVSKFWEEFEKKKSEIKRKIFACTADMYFHFNKWKKSKITCSLLMLISSTETTWWIFVKHLLEFLDKNFSKKEFFEISTTFCLPWPYQDADQRWVTKFAKILIIKKIPIYLGQNGYMGQLKKLIHPIFMRTWILLLIRIRVCLKNEKHVHFFCVTLPPQRIGTMTIYFQLDGQLLMDIFSTTYVSIQEIQIVILPTTTMHIVRKMV